MPTHEITDVAEHLKGGQVGRNTGKALERARHLATQIEKDDALQNASYTQIGNFLTIRHSPEKKKKPRRHVETPEEEEERYARMGVRKATVVACERARRLMEEIEGRERKKGLGTKVGGVLVGR
ncbi:hypothetical protein HDV00_006198 [Rhizophlyctis rosea]|nr:hypothetical protein HDV00_006198 [Rhizophlyctis rosea]